MGSHVWFLTEVLFVLAICNSRSTINGFSPLLVRQPRQGRPQKQRQRSDASRLQSIPTPIDTLTSGLASIFRLPRGVTVKDEAIENNDQQQQRVVLKEFYNIENDVDCRRVRELVTEYNLCVEQVICASPKSRIMSNSPFKFPVPQLVVAVQKEGEGEREQITLSGVEDITEYLDSTFGDGKEKAAQDNDAKAIVLNLWNVAGNYAASVLRLGRGADRVLAAGSMIDNDDDSPLPMANRPQKPLVLYDYEGNQFCRLVREVLTELDLVYELRTAGKGSPRRQNELSALNNDSTQCPFLVDPNTGESMAESVDIIAYLYKTYALWTPANEQLQWISQTVLPIFKPLFSWQTKQQAGVHGGQDGTDTTADQARLQKAKADIEATIAAHPIVIYTYEWSPFSGQATALLDNLDIPYHEQSLGREWLPGLINSDGGAATRAALLDMTGQSSLPHVFIGGETIGGLYSGTPGLVPGLEQGILLDMIDAALGRDGGDTATASATKNRPSSTTVIPTVMPEQTLPLSSTASQQVAVEESGEFQ